MDTIFATCPECRGPLEELRENGGPIEFRCLVGHRYSPEGLLKAHYDTQERELWSAVVALEESPQIVQRAAEAIKPELREAAQKEARRKVEQAKAIRKVIEELRPYIPD